MPNTPPKDSSNLAQTVGVWTKVDQMPEPAFFIQLLDAINGSAWRQAHKQRTLACLNVQEGVHLLDIGCGTGDDVRLLARQVGPTGKVVGIDPSATMITEARTRTSGSALPVEFYQGSVYDLPFPDHTFDGGYSFLTFDVLERPQHALLELIRVIKSGGRIAISALDHDALIVNAPDRSLTRKLLHFFCDSNASGWIGRQLPGFCVEAELHEVTVTPDTRTRMSADYAGAKQLLQRIATSAQAAGIVTADEAAGWLRSLDEAHHAGQFFMASTSFIVSGRKP